MKIIFTKHAERKFEDLRLLGLKITRSQVKNILNKSENEDTISDYPNVISSGKMDHTHTLRVVHRMESGRIIVITFYPAKIGRYYKL